MAETFNDMYEKMSDEDLISEAKALDYSINVVECYGTKDLRLLDLAIGMLIKRGYEPCNTITFIKKESDEE